VLASEVVSPSHDEDRRIANTLIAWLSLPQLGHSDVQVPVSAHPVSDCSGGCSNLEGQILLPNPLTEWLRLPLHLPKRNRASRSSNDSPAVVMDTYLESLLMQGDYELFAGELTRNRDWCAPVSSTYRWVGGFAELASARIAHEIVRLYFPLFSSRRCEHRSLGNAGQKAIMWDPRLLLPTPAGRSIRQALLLKEYVLCGPHPLLRAIESYLPDVIPLGIQVAHSPSAIFPSNHTSNVDFVSIGTVAFGNCRVPPVLKYLGILQTALGLSLVMMRPVGRLFPRAVRAAVRRRLPSLLSQNLPKRILRRNVSRSLGFSPTSVREQAL